MIFYLQWYFVDVDVFQYNMNVYSNVLDLNDATIYDDYDYHIY